jgi:hypothetical protein
MTDYVKSTNFASKDALASGNPLKIVKGLEIDIEFNNISNAVATKSNSLDTALTGIPTAPTAAPGTNTSQIATTAFVTAATSATLQTLYPVGSIYINAGVTTNPATLFGFGTWVAFGAGRVMVGFNAGDTLFDALEETGGSKDAITVSHTHSITMSAHAHSIGTAVFSTFGGDTTGYAAYPDNNASRPQSTGASSPTGTAASTGSSGTNANLQPYITVAMWKRTA